VNDSFLTAGIGFSLWYLETSVYVSCISTGDGYCWSNQRCFWGTRPWKCIFVTYPSCWWHVPRG
jgi:hypothetical protein